MDTQLCACDAGLSNLGLSNCENMMKAARKFVFTPQYSFAGAINRIDSSATLDSAWMYGLVGNPDKSLRVYPSPYMVDFTWAKDAPVMETHKDKSSVFVSENIRKVMATLTNAPARFKAKFEAIRCNSNTRMYVIDKLGNLWGMRNALVNDDGYLYPIPMNVQSVVADFKFADDENNSQIELSFEIPTYVDDALFCMISSKSFTDFNALDVTGLYDADVKYSNIASGAVTATIDIVSNTIDTPEPVQGLVTADFISSVTSVASKLRNTTDNADVAITSATESSPGVYDLVYTLAAAKDVVLFATLPGADFSLMKTRKYTTV